MNRVNASQSFCIYFRSRRDKTEKTMNIPAFSPVIRPCRCPLFFLPAPRFVLPVRYDRRSSSTARRNSPESRCRDGLTSATRRYISPPRRQPRTTNGLPHRYGTGKTMSAKEKGEKNGNEPSHDETFPHRTYIEMKKLSRT